MKKFFTALACLFVVAAIALALLPGSFPQLASIIKSEKTNADFGIAPCVSSVDMDGDGVDDQTDILEGAKAYVATKPQYKSAYYEGGYPTDGYGVCTDVVAQALLAAGYELRTLVDEDIHQAPEAYGYITPDSNIDFRRVPNLNVYFSRHAITLTTDVNDIEAWQGGDIVVFENHVGIVSDKRNLKGVPYVIHHYIKGQKNYEEDILWCYGKIVGHYRVSK